MGKRERASHGLFIICWTRGLCPPVLKKTVVDHRYGKHALLGLTKECVRVWPRKEHCDELFCGCEKRFPFWTGKINAWLHRTLARGWSTQISVAADRLKIQIHECHRAISQPANSVATHDNKPTCQWRDVCSLLTWVNKSAFHVYCAVFLPTHLSSRSHMVADVSFDPTKDNEHRTVSLIVNNMVMHAMVFTALAIIGWSMLWFSRRWQ